MFEAKKTPTCTLERTAEVVHSARDHRAFKIVDVVGVEGLLEVTVLGERRLRLERLDELVPLRQVLALRTLARDACLAEEQPNVSECRTRGRLGGQSRVSLTVDGIMEQTRSCCRLQNRPSNGCSYIYIFTACQPA